MQEYIENNIDVDTGADLLILGNFNGRISSIEEDITSDINGRIIEEWIKGR